MACMYDIVARIKSGNDGLVIQGASFNQFEFDELPDSALIFAEEVLKKMLILMKECYKNNREYGCFFFGKEISPNFIVINDCSETDFISEATMISVSENNIKDLENKVTEFIEKKRNCDCVIHFHTHPDLESHGYMPRRYSDQDLYTYGILQTEFQYLGLDTFYLGGLIFPAGDDQQLSFVFYDQNYEKFYKLTNIYYYSSDNKFMKIGKVNGIPTLRNDLINEVSEVEKNKLLEKMKDF